MKDYTLKLYALPQGARTARFVRGEYKFQQSDDGAALEQAKSDYAEGIGDSDNAILFGTDDAIIWQKKPWNF